MRRRHAPEQRPPKGPDDETVIDKAVRIQAIRAGARTHPVVQDLGCAGDYMVTRGGTVTIVQNVELPGEKLTLWYTFVPEWDDSALRFKVACKVIREPTNE